jgi:uncharacterized protein (DUF1778 family)
MALEREAFTRTRLDEERAKDRSRPITVRLNIEERQRLEEAALYLQQEKLSTVLKQLAEVGLIVLQDQKTRAIIDVLFKNERNNKRLGIQQADPKFIQM